MEELKRWLVRPVLLGMVFFFGDVGVRAILRLVQQGHQIQLMQDHDQNTQKKLDELLERLEKQENELQAISNEVHRFHPGR